MNSRYSTKGTPDTVHCARWYAVTLFRTVATWRDKEHSPIRHPRALPRNWPLQYRRDYGERIPRVGGPRTSTPAEEAKRTGKLLRELLPGPTHRRKLPRQVDS